VHEDSVIEEFLPKVLEGRSVAEVVDRAGHTLGFVSEKELARSLSKN
jgi:uncharacterized protein YqeY|tara:strand:+ start:1537 stop:1677 length:141 start_codon:yes stop_codon:yes gene_type:complete